MNEKPVTNKTEPKKSKKTNGDLIMKYLKIGMEEKVQKETKKK